MKAGCFIARMLAPASTQKEKHNAPTRSDPELQAGISCASACIRINYGNCAGGIKYFHPVYTHQIFEEEVIRGYQPFQSDALESQELDSTQVASQHDSDGKIPRNTQATLPQRHSSFHHPSAALASQRIQVTILIAPSCKTCSIHIKTTSILDTRRSEKETESTLSGQKRKQCEDVEKCPTDNRLAGSNLLETETSIQVPPMDREEILQRLSKALPEIVSTTSSVSPSDSFDLSIFTSNNFSKTDDYLDSPIGTIISTYTKDRSAGNDNLSRENELSFPLDEYVLTLADGKAAGVNEYHHQVQKLSLFYIENADEVDLTSDQGGGNWKVLYLFAKHHLNDVHMVRGDGQEGRGSKNNNDQVVSEQVSVYSLVGYMTLFTFYSPFKKPKPGNVLRICQALILPPFQRQGHGKAMMTCLYDYARGGRSNKEDDSESYIHDDNIVEVNVEDPAPGFSYMRDSVDYCLFEQLFVRDKDRRQKEIQEILDQYLLSDDNGSSWKPLTDHHAMILADEAKITKVQIQIAFEIHKLSRMNAMIRESEIKWKKGGLNSTSSLEEKRNNLFREYRLMVKKRLNHTYKEEIGAHGSSKAEKQAKLSEIFEDAYQRYCSILGYNEISRVPS